MTAPRIRPATSADLGDLLALDAALFGNDAWSSTAMCAEIGPPAEIGRCCLVAVVGATTVGYAAARTAAEPADLLRVGVALGHRRSGVGSSLVTAVIDRARAAGRDGLLLEVARGNSSAVAMYERLGFAVIATRPRYYADGADALVMSRRLLLPSLEALDEQRHC